MVKKAKRAARIAAGLVAVVVAFGFATYAVVWTVGKLNGYDCGFVCKRPNAR